MDQTVSDLQSETVRRIHVLILERVNFESLIKEEEEEQEEED